jgi:hypothetical protein
MNVDSHVSEGVRMVEYLGALITVENEIREEIKMKINARN